MPAGRPGRAARTGFGGATGLGEERRRRTAAGPAEALQLGRRCRLGWRGREHRTLRHLSGRQHAVRGSPQHGSRLYGAYTGNLYQVRRTSDKATKDIAVLAPGGFADSAVQDAFCVRHGVHHLDHLRPVLESNHLGVAGRRWLAKAAGSECSRGQDQGGRPYGLRRLRRLRQDWLAAIELTDAKGIATGDQAEAKYMVVDGKQYSNGCCFDYGNAETTASTTATPRWRPYTGGRHAVGQGRRQRSMDRGGPGKWHVARRGEECARHKISDLRVVLSLRRC